MTTLRSIVAGSILLLPMLAQAAASPNTEQLAPGVWAAGFSARYNSANCGWIVLADRTVLIDPPRDVAIDEIARLTGKPVRALVLTNPQERASVDIPLLEQSGPDIEIHAYAQGRAVFLPRERVLFGGPAVINGPRVKLPGSDTAEWIATLVKLQKLGAAKVVPGFGTWGGPEILDRQRRFLMEMRRQVGYLISMGRPLAVIEQEVRLPADYLVWMPVDDPRPEDIRHVYGELTEPSPRFDGPEPHALVLIGDRYHEPGHIEAGLQPVFEATGVTPHYVVDVRALNAQNLAKVKLLVILRDGMLWPDGISKPRQIWMTPEQEKAVVDFVTNGGAFLNLHNAMGIYPENGPYLNLVGGRYIGHGPLERFRVEVVDHEHPITRGVRDFFAADEQHTPPFDKDKVHLLLQNRSDDGKVAAAGWAYEPGRGRLCHLASGHTREALMHPEYQRLLRNAVNWCLRR